MKKKMYCKPTLLNHSDEDAVFNSFPSLLALMIQSTMWAVLQGEFNFVSGLFLVIAGGALAAISYGIGKGDGEK